MDEKVLQANYFNAVVTWIETHGGLGNKPPTALFDLVLKDGKIEISSWRHESKQPTAAGLMTQTLDAVNLSAEKRQFLQSLQSSASRQLTTVKRDSFGAVPVGTVIYNTTVNRLQVYIGDTWATVAHEG